jgi:hypothetical protein
LNSISEADVAKVKTTAILTVMDKA